MIVSLSPLHVTIRDRIDQAARMLRVAALAKSHREVAFALEQLAGVLQVTSDRALDLAELEQDGALDPAYRRELLARVEAFR